MKTDKIKNGP